MSELGNKALVVTSPAPLLSVDGRPVIFLAGSIDNGAAPDWQSQCIDALADEPLIILNPRRADWDGSWRAEADDPQFRVQVEWELSTLERADIIAMYLAPTSQAPISLLELGLHARSGKVILCCPDGFWRKGNVDIVAKRFGIETVSTLSDLIETLRTRVSEARPPAALPVTQPQNGRL